MKNLQCILASVLMMCTSTYALESNPATEKCTISLHVTIALRIPHHNISINIERMNSSYFLKVDTTPMEGHGDIENAEFHKTRKLNEEEYNQLVILMENLPWSTLKKKESFFGLDGSSWRLTYDNGKILRKASIWSPDYETKERGVQEFLGTARFILNMAEINSRTLYPSRPR